MKRSFPFAIAILFTLLLAAPAAAQTPGLTQQQSGTLGVRIHQNVTGGDEVQLYGLNQATLYNSDTTSNNLAKNVSDDLGLQRSDISVTTPTLFDITGGGDKPNTQVQIDVDKHLFVHSADQLTFSLDTALLSGTARNYGFTKLEVGVCPASVPTDNQSSRPPDEKVDDCDWWTQSVSRGADAVKINMVQSPDASNYWSLVGVLFLVTVVLSVLCVVIGIVLRRIFKTLTTGALVVALSATATAWIVSVIATFAIIGGANSVNDLLLANNYGYGQQLLAGFLPGLLLGLPGVILAVLLVRLPPTPYQPQPQYASGVYGTAPTAPPAPGVPGWLAGQPQAPQPAPQAPQWQQPPQPQQPWSAPPQPQQPWSQPQPQQPPQAWPMPQQQPPPPSGQPSQEQPPPPEEPKTPPPPSWSPPA